MEKSFRNPLKVIVPLFAVVVLLTGIALIHLYDSRPRIAYVRSLELIYGYNGMKSAHAEFKQQTVQWQANIDTLKRNYQQLQEKLPTFSPEERAQKEQELEKMKEDFQKYTAVIGEQAKEKEASLTEGVLNQVNSYVQRFAKRKGYDLVLGTEQSGSIIYGTEAFDITDDVLEELNREYKVIPAPVASVNE